MHGASGPVNTPQGGLFWKRVEGRRWLLSTHKRRRGPVQMSPRQECRLADSVRAYLTGTATTGFHFGPGFPGDGGEGKEKSVMVHLHV